MKIKSKFLLSSLVLLSMTAYANTQKHVLVAPQCLLKNAAVNFKQLSTEGGLALIEVGQSGVDKLIAAKNHHSATPCGGFMDVTTEWKQYKKQKTLASPAKKFLSKYVEKNQQPTFAPSSKYSIKYPTQVNQLLNTMNAQDMWKDLEKLTSFDDRYANSNNGVKAAEWLKAQVEAMAKLAGRTDVTTYFVKTGSDYKQPSLVIKIGNSNEPGVVIGGHMDTLSSNWGKKPGADDDGSGSVTVLEVARTIINSNMNFKKPIYFIWYSAEEEGLIGSGYVVRDFKAKKIPVDAVIQFDMTGYAYKNDPTLWLITDNVNSELTNYLESLVKTYVKQPVEYTECGYACSDHASWNQYGFNSSFAFEASFDHDNPYIHTSQDTMDRLSLNHMSDYAKLGISFAVELAEPV